MSKVNIIYNWVNENLDKVYFTKEQKIMKVGLSINKTTKNGEVVEDSTLSFRTDGGNLISLKEEWIEKITLAEDKQSMIVLLTDDSPLTRHVNSDRIVFSNDTSLYDKEEATLDEDSDATKNETSVGEALHQEEKEWPTKEYINEKGDTCIKPIICIKGNSLVQNYIKNNKYRNLGIVYFNEKYGFGGNGDCGVHEKRSLCHLSERFLIVSEGDEQYEEAPCLVLNENEEVRVLTPSWAVESGKPSILCGKGTDNDRFIIYPIIDYPTPVMGTFVETEKQFDNLFNFKPLSCEVKEYDNLYDEVTHALAKGITKKAYDGEKDTKSIANETEEGRYEKTMSINTDEMRNTLKGLVSKFVDDTNNKIEKDGCAAKNFKDVDSLVNEVTKVFPQIKVINFDKNDEKAKEFVKELIQEQENFSRKVHGDEAVDATLKCLNKCGSDKLNTLVADLIKDKKILLGEEEADENDKEQIDECIASDEVDDNEIEKHFKHIAEYMQKMKVSNIYFNLEADGTVTCESRTVASYYKN